MDTHLPLALGLAGGAAIAIVVGSLTRMLRDAGPDARSRRVAAGLAAWLLLDVALGAAHVFSTGAHRWVPGLVPGIIVPLLAGAWLLARPGEVSRVAAALPLRSLVAVQSYRVAGAVFILGWADGRLPGVFALPAGIGDVLVGLAAPFVAARLTDEGPRSRRFALVWTIAGVTDLVMAVALGALSSPSPFQALALGHPNHLISTLPLVLVPVFGVPLSLLLHLVTVRRMLATGGRARSSPGALVPSTSA